MTERALAIDTDVLDRIGLEVDMRLTDVWAMVFEKGEELDTEFLGWLLRLSYVTGYWDALSEGERGALCEELGYPIPERRTASAAAPPGGTPTPWARRESLSRHRLTSGMDGARELWDGLPSVVVTAIGVVLLLAAAVLAQRLVVRAIRRSYLRREAAARDSGELARMTRQRTLVSLVESLVRYGIYGSAIVVAVGMVTGGRSSAFFGASVVAVLIGFSLQQLFADVVAGALILFEGTFGVGDVITIHQHNVSGTVEAFSLRTTTLLTLAGDHVTITNGDIASVTRWAWGQREHRIELLVRGGDAVDRVAALCTSEGDAASALWVRPPLVASTEPLAAAVDGPSASTETLVRVIVTVVVSPEHDALVARLAALLEAACGPEHLVGPVSTVAHHVPTFEAWRAGLLLRD